MTDQDELPEYDGFEVEGLEVTFPEGLPSAAPAPAPLPEFRHPIIDRVAAATGGQVFNCACMLCPLAHWEVLWTVGDTEIPPAPDAPLPPPVTKGLRWGIEAFCRARHSVTASYEAKDVAPGKLVRQINTRVVSECSDQKDAISRWNAQNVEEE